MVGADESTVLWRPQVITLLIGRNYCKNFVAPFLIDSLSDVKVQLHQFIGFMFFLSYCQSNYYDDITLGDPIAKECMSKIIIPEKECRKIIMPKNVLVYAIEGM